MRNGCLFLVSFLASAFLWLLVLCGLFARCSSSCSFFRLFCVLLAAIFFCMFPFFLFWYAFSVFFFMHRLITFLFVLVRPLLCRVAIALQALGRFDDLASVVELLRSRCVLGDIFFRVFFWQATYCCCVSWYFPPARNLMIRGGLMFPSSSRWHPRTLTREMYACGTLAFWYKIFFLPPPPHPPSPPHPSTQLSHHPAPRRLRRCPLVTDDYQGCSEPAKFLLRCFDAVGQFLELEGEEANSPIEVKHKRDSEELVLPHFLRPCLGDSRVFVCIYGR